ncbi:hypothetical protein NERG_00067 [Nematocida ausubeli]|uniref:Uncharacterized protein n=1 Tax=Nematocida ausubeli (strain ATCC PRA-371 / ERTm2) TaxID=1913371 RepID=H8Z8Z6_NEMA1|nr:hypothetical protein NERG_00067 [Nematocida ausubeli]
MGKNLRTRMLTFGVCAFILFSILPQLDLLSINKFNLLCVLCLAYFIGSTYYQAVFILYFILNSADILFIIDNIQLVLFYSLVYSTDIPILANLSYGRAIYRSFKKKSIIPIMVSAMAGLAVCGWRIFEAQKISPMATSPLMSSSFVHLHSGLIYISSTESYYGNYNRKQGSGNRAVVGTKEKTQNTEWKVILEGLEGNPAPTVSITSGSVVYLQNTQTKEYMYTADVASPLTLSNQEVSTTLALTDANRFLILNTDGDMTKTVSIFSDGLFYLKNVSTGVFIRVLKRKTPIEDVKIARGYEINGQKETGVNIYVGGSTCLWSARVIDTSKVTIKDWCKNILAHIYRAGKKRLYIISRIESLTEEEKPQYNHHYTYMGRYNVLMYGVLFMFSGLRGMLGKERIWEKVISCLIDILLCLVFKKKCTKAVVYTAGVIGIQNGLKLHKLVREIITLRTKVKKD